MAKLRPPSSRRFTTTTIFIIHLLLLLSPHSLTVTATSTHHRHQKQQQQQQRIKNIVVLVMENRSFDHMLGWMKRSINPNIDGLIGNECNRRITTDPKSPLICVTDDARFVDPDPGHSFEDIRAQVFGNSAFPDMSGFVQQALNMSFSSSDEDRLLPETVMRAFSPDDLPIYETLVREYAVFDRWFASLPASTQPNRLFVYSATSAGATSNDKLRLASGFPQRTIFDSIHDSGLDFGVYSQHIPTTLFFRSLRRPGSLLRKFHRWGTFFDHAKSGLLRDLTVLEPRYFDLPGFGGAADDDHPSHDVGNGQRLVKEVYEALRASPQWNTTLLVITYDEHGGFYDHVPTPYQGVPNPDGINGHGPDGFKFDRLGVRVPTIMVSPWIKKGTVVNRAKGPTPTSEYEHSSIPATVKKMFNLNADFLTKRDAWAGTFEHVVDGLDSPRTDCPEILPDPKPIRKTQANPGKTLTEFQSELVQLASALSGDILHLHKAEDPEEDPIRKMTVGEADEYINKALSKVFGSAEEDAAVVSDGDGTDAEDDELCPTPAP